MFLYQLLGGNNGIQSTTSQLSFISFARKDTSRTKKSWSTNVCFQFRRYYLIVLMSVLEGSLTLRCKMKCSWACDMLFDCCLHCIIVWCTVHEFVSAGWWIYKWGLALNSKKIYTRCSIKYLWCLGNYNSCVLAAAFRNIWLWIIKYETG